MIEDLKIDKLDDVSSTFLEVFQSEPFNFEWITAEKATGYIYDLFNDSGFKGFAFKVGDETVGYCMGAYNRNMIVEQYHIKEIFIKKNCQQFGYGKKMIEEIEKYLKNEDIDLITLYTNIGIPAYNFYLKNDFKVMSDTVHMIKLIK